MRTLAVVAFACGPLAAWSQAPANQATLDSITARGRALAAYDFAAWHGTDAVMTLHPVFDTTLASVYLVRREDDGALEVAFGGLNAARDTFFVLYTARKDSARAPFVAQAVSPRRADTGYYARAARAAFTPRLDFGKRDRTYNEAVIPADSGTWWVYFYPAPREPDVWPLGADIRYRVSADGRTVLAKHMMHKAIVEGRMPDSTVMATHTAVVDDQPEDTDVMVVLQRQPRVPELVLTVPGRHMYMIDITGAIVYQGILTKDKPGS